MPIKSNPALPILSDVKSIPIGDPVILTKVDAGNIVNQPRCVVLHSDVVLPAPPFTKKPVCTSLGYFDIFYNRILLEPSVIDAGNVSSQQTYSIKLWNGFFSEKILTQIVKTNDDGVVINDSHTYPFAINGLRELSYIVTIDPIGPPIINTTFSWIIDGVPITLTITGTRVVAFTIKPNWSNPVVERLEWLTDIIQAASGKEQRIKLRSKPRLSFDYDLTTMSTADSQRLINYVYFYQKYTLLCPCWINKHTIKAALNPGDTEILVNVKPNLLMSSKQGILISGHKYEVVVLKKVTSLKCELEFPIEIAWPIDTELYPLLEGRFSESVDINAITDHYLSMSIAMATDPVQTNAYLPTLSAPKTFKGFEFWDTGTNWDADVSHTYTITPEIIDNETGAITYLQSLKPTTTTKSIKVILNGSEKINNFKGFLNRREGKLNPFWLIFEVNNMTLARIAGSADTEILVLNNGVLPIFNIDIQHKYLRFRLISGEFIIKEITNVSKTDNINHVKLTIDSSFGKMIYPESISKIEFLKFCRLATDTIELTYITDSIATCEFPIQTTDN